MRFTVLFFLVILMVTACREHKDSADDKKQKQLSGTWMFEARYARGHNAEQTLTFGPDGSFAVRISRPSRTNGPRIITMEGTFRVEGGFLVTTLTKDSQNYASIPGTNRFRIVRIDGGELELDEETLPDGVYPTNPIVYLKQRK